MPIDLPFLLLGADSLWTRRSGIGRMTAEITARAAVHPGLSGIALLAGGDVHPMHDGLLAPGADALMPDRRTTVLSQLFGEIGVLRAVRNDWRRRRINSKLRGFPARRDQIVYHESNFITVPFDGPTFLSVHDLFWMTDPNFVPIARRRWLDRNLPRVLRDAHGFACVSNFTARELIRLFPETASRVRVVPQGVSPMFHPRTEQEAAAVLAKYNLPDRGFVFAASTLEPRKNFDRLRLAFAGLPAMLRERFPLVIAGGNGWGGALSGAAPGDVRLLGHVPDEDLAALTARAAIYAFVSVKEGFGLPILEAMASGTPLLTSSGSAMEETAGGAAYLADPLDIESIRRGLRDLLEDTALRDQFRQAGLPRAAAFSWETTIDGLVALWRGDA